MDTRTTDDLFAEWKRWMKLQPTGALQHRAELLEVVALAEALSTRIEAGAPEPKWTAAERLDFMLWDPLAYMHPSMRLALIVAERDRWEREEVAIGDVETALRSAVQVDVLQAFVNEMADALERQKDEPYEYEITPVKLRELARTAAALRMRG